MIGSFFFFQIVFMVVALNYDNNKLDEPLRTCDRQAKLYLNYLRLRAIKTENPCGIKAMGKQ